MMNEQHKKKVSDKLTALAQLDIDAILAYQQAIAAIDDEHIRGRLNEFCDDHKRHVEDLSAAIKTLGGTPPALQRDFKGFLIEGMTSIAGAVGTKSALMAMSVNETLTNSRYKAAQTLAVDDGLKRLLENNYADEQRHLAFIKEMLRDKFGKGKKDTAA